MLERFSLRARMAAFFALIALAIPVVIDVALWLAVLRMEGDPVPPLVLLGGAASFALVGLVVWVAMLFDTNIARPIVGLSRDLQTLLHANPDHEISENSAAYLGMLAPTLREASQAMRQLRTDVDSKISAATQSLERQRARLETVLRDLNEGVIVCNLDHQVLLYNRRALQALHYGGNLGLGRSIFTVVNRPPFLNTAERLSNRVTSGRYKTHPDYLMAPLVFATQDGRHIMQGKMSLILGERDETPEGYVLTFSEATRQMATLASRGKLIANAIADLRHPLSELRANCDLVSSAGESDRETREASIATIAKDCDQLTERLTRLAVEYRADDSALWPMSDVNSDNLLSCLSRRYREHPVVHCDVSGEPCWLRCDSNLVVELVDKLIRSLLEATAVQTFTLVASCSPERRSVDVIWRGEPVVNNQIGAWLEEQVEIGAGTMSGQDILDLHHSAACSESLADGRAALRLTLPSPAAEHSVVASRAPPINLEFYDFDLIHRHEETGDLARRRLRDLTYVVFDTETTGLEPSNGDEMVSIAGVRIVNRRVLTGEKFDQLINPGRSIPKRSTEVHGISEEMVADAPGVEEVLPRFRDYVGDSVLVAHNAAFDLRFLQLKEKATGVRIDNAVLDTVLLSAIVHDHTDQHTLDAVAERFAIEIPEEVRHTALGDSLATAHVFLRLMELLEANGITTLGEAQEASEQLVQIRRRQGKY